MDILAQFKLSIGILTADTSLDAYYNNLLNTAKADLLSDDISATIIETDMGKTATIFYATLLYQNQDISTNQTIQLFRNKLSAMTKGERYDNGA